jgi:hypothetical protein
MPEALSGPSPGKHRVLSKWSSKSTRSGAVWSPLEREILPMIRAKLSRWGWGRLASWRVAGREGTPTRGTPGPSESRRVVSCRSDVRGLCRRQPCCTCCHCRHHPCRCRYLDHAVVRSLPFRPVRNSGDGSQRKRPCQPPDLKPKIHPRCASRRSVG